MNEISRLAEKLEQIHLGGAWHGPSIAENLEGVDAASAARRPLPGAHTIWEIVHHLRVTNESVRRHLTGESPSDEADWPQIDDPTEEAWQAELTRLRATQEALRAAVASLPAGVLDQNLPNSETTHATELYGILHHDLYHAGQLGVLRKAG